MNLCLARQQQGKAVSFSMLMCTFMPVRKVNPSDEAAVELDSLSKHVKSTCVRWLNLGHALLYKAAEGSEYFQHLVDEGFATPDEMALLSQGSGMRFPLVYSWLGDMLASAQRAKLLTDGQYRLLLDDVMASRMNASDVFMYLQAQIPYYYCHFMTIMVRLQ